ncbi:MAG TPA: SGNH/GDSL hydrolase family protein [Pseudonocardiaceae bacterium]|jgi:lysophospholipase L1-like esterase
MIRLLTLAGAVLALLGVLAVPASANSTDVTKLAIIGDSITTGYNVPPGDGYAALLAADPGSSVLPLAHNGATVRTWLTLYQGDLDQLTTWQATTVIIALGGNDWYGERSPADYETDVTYLVWQIRSQLPNARVILWHYYPFGIGQSSTACDVWPCTPATSTWATYANAARDAAIRNYLGYIDDSASAPDGHPWSYYWGPDQVHLTIAGHQQLHDDIRARLLACC